MIIAIKITLLILGGLVLSFLLAAGAIVLVHETLDK
jgi:hypothetical protein